MRAHRHRCSRRAARYRTDRPESLEARWVLATLVDLDDDRDLDVLVSSPFALSQEVSWWENTNGLGSFTDRGQISPSAVGAITADLDRDGDADVITERSWYENKSGGFATRHDYGAAGAHKAPQQLLATDIGTDGDLDLVVVQGASVYIYDNTNGLGSLSLARTIDTTTIAQGTPITVNAEDVNRDGRVDLVVGYSTGGIDIPAYRLSVFLQANDGTFSEKQIFGRDLFEPRFDPAPQVKLLDIEGDNDVDVIITEASSFAESIRTSVIRNLSDGNFSASSPIFDAMFGPGAPYSEILLGFSDIDRDGDFDAIINVSRMPFEPLGSLASEINDFWLLNDGNSFTRCRCAAGARATSDGGDINGDQVPDFLAGPNFGTMVWYDGAASTTLGKLNAVTQAIRDQVFANNLNFDGDTDVDTNDLTSLVEVELDTAWGDADANGRFETSDLTAVFQVGEYEDGIARNSTWSRGDWNGDGEFDSADFVRVFEKGGYRQTTRLTGPRQQIASVTTTIPALTPGKAAAIIDGKWGRNFEDHSARWNVNGSATFRIAFDASYDLETFRLANGQGDSYVRKFTLIFRDAAQTEIGQYQGTANGQLFGAFEDFQIGNRLNVASVDLIVHAADTPELEIQEIEFIGKPVA